MRFQGVITKKTNGLVSFEVPSFCCQSWCEAREDVARCAAEWLAAAVFGSLGARIEVSGVMSASRRFYVETKNSKEVLGFLISQHRKRANLTVRELAAKAGLRSHTNVVHYEMGKSEPSLSKLERLLFATGTDIRLDICS